jgi:hypothetical protein
MRRAIRHLFLEKKNPIIIYHYEVTPIEDTANVNIFSLNNTYMTAGKAVTL